jgi:hypothetical protein
MTKNLKLFSLYSVVSSVVFFAILNWMLYDPHKRGIVMGLVYVLYAVGFSLLGRHLGGRDSQRSVRYNLRVRYGITPAIIATLIGVLWVLLFHRARSFLIVLVIYSAVVILCLAIGFAFSKIGVKGISKGKMFK